MLRVTSKYEVHTTKCYREHTLGMIYILSVLLCTDRIQIPIGKFLAHAQTVCTRLSFPPTPFREPGDKATETLAKPGFCPRHIIILRKGPRCINTKLIKYSQQPCFTHNLRPYIANEMGSLIEQTGHLEHY